MADGNSFTHILIKKLVGRLGKVHRFPLYYSVQLKSDLFMKK